MIELIPNEWRYRDINTGEICPWYVKSVVEMLYGMDLNGMNIFEYGVGDSTLWYRNRQANVSGVDSNPEWAQRMKVKHCDQLPAYPDTINEFDCLFDIIVIDGIFRDFCLGASCHKLKPGGFFIIDNYEQPSVENEWKRTNALIKSYNMKIEVYKEEHHLDWQSAIIRL